MSRLSDSMIIIDGDRGDSAPRLHVACRACAMDGSMDAPFDENASSSARRNITVVVTRAGLGYREPAVGDVITWNGARFAVRKVEPFYSREYILDCRSC